MSLPPHRACIDHEARQDARLALQAHRQHEEHCNERQSGMAKRVDAATAAIASLEEKQSEGDGKLHARLDRMTLMLLAGMGAIGMALLGLVATLVTMYVKGLNP